MTDLLEMQDFAERTGQNFHEVGELPSGAYLENLRKFRRANAQRSWDLFIRDLFTSDQRPSTRSTLY